MQSCSSLEHSHIILQYSIVAKLKGKVAGNRIKINLYSSEKFSIHRIEFDQDMQWNINTTCYKMLHFYLFSTYNKNRKFYLSFENTFHIRITSYRHLIPLVLYVNIFINSVKRLRVKFDQLLKKTDISVICEFLQTNHYFKVMNRFLICIYMSINVEFKWISHSAVGLYKS